jgi:hypothetical protein
MMMIMMMMVIMVMVLCRRTEREKGYQSWYEYSHQFSFHS